MLAIANHLQILKRPEGASSIWYCHGEQTPIAFPTDICANPQIVRHWKGQNRNSNMFYPGSCLSQICSLKYSIIPCGTMLTHTHTWYIYIHHYVRSCCLTRRSLKILALWKDHSFHLMSFNEIRNMYNGRDGITTKSNLLLLWGQHWPQEPLLRLKTKLCLVGLYRHAKMKDAL